MIEKSLDELRRVFRSSGSKHAAHKRASSVLVDVSADPTWLTEVLRRHVADHRNLQAGHYPVVSVKVETNPDFDLVANCWLPLPGRETDLTTKSIHHHGSMLLTTVTAHGPGYEHWLFEPPELIDDASLLHRLRLRTRELHPRGHIAFVDQREAHVPMYPSEHTVTLALWSHSTRTGWRDRLKRVSLIQRRAPALRRAASRLGLANALDVNAIDLFDFFPDEGGFVGIRERREFPLGPNEHYLQSLVSVLQATGNESLLGHLETAAARLPAAAGDRARALLERARRGERLEAVFSEGHIGVAQANFRAAAIDLALSRTRH